MAPRHVRNRVPWGERILIAFLLIPGFLVFGFTETLFMKSFWFVLLIAGLGVLVYVGAKRYWDLGDDA